MHAREYVADVGFGAVTGVFTGGAGAIGESVATNVAKQGAKIFIRASTGVAIGVGAKAITEVKECSTTDKKWDDFGKTLDSNGNVNVAGTVVSWTSSGLVGAIGVGSSQIATKFTQGVGPGIECLTRVTMSGTTAAASDAVIQGANIATGVQDSFNVKQCVTSAAVSSITTLGQEGVKQGIYKVNGGKERFLNNKANDRMIEDNVHDGEDQQSAKSGLNKLKEINSKKLNQEYDKAAKNTNLKKQISDIKTSKINLNKVVNDIDRQLKENGNSIKSENDATIKINRQAYQEKLLQLRKEHSNSIRQLTNQQNKLSADIKKITLMTDQNIHPLEGNLLGNSAVDVSPPSDGPRNAQRLIIKNDKNGNPKVIGYLQTHDYDNFSEQKGIEQHKYYKTVGEKVQNLVAFIETTSKAKQEEEDNQSN